jgi:hypothetical protein
MKALYIILIFVFLTGCTASSGQLTATAVVAQAQTRTAAPTLTSTFTPTFTPQPTATPPPTKTPTPMPAAVGETVQYKNLEITLLEAVTHTQVMLSDFYGYDANEGYIFIDLAVRVRNRGEQTVGVTMRQVYLVDTKGKAWPVFGGGYKTVNLERPFHPMASIKLDIVSASQFVRFEKDTYLRLVWPVPEHQNFLFGIEDSPQPANDFTPLPAPAAR